MAFAFDVCVKQLKFLETLMFELSCRVHLGQSPGEDPVLNSEESRSLGRSVATTGSDTATAAYNRATDFEAE